MSFLPLGLALVVLILSPYAMIANGLANIDGGDSAPLTWHYLVAFMQSILIYGITFSVQNGRSRKTTPKGGAHLRSLVITFIVITLAALGGWYSRSQG